MLFRKKNILFFAISCLSFFFLSFFINLENAGAISVSTSSFDLHYKYDSNSQYQWKNGILYGSSNGTTVTDTGGINIYQFVTDPVQAGGSSASIHFETNIVSTWYYDFPFTPWVNLDRQNVIVCNSSPSASSTISRNLSTATTLWGNRQANTLTLYGDVTVTGLTAGTTYQFICAVGSDNYSFYDIGSSIGASSVWFEQNPLTISWFTDESQALMQTQINQNQIIINQSNEYYDKTYESIDNISDQTTSDIQGSENQKTTDLITALGSLVGAFMSIQPASDCNILLDFPNYAGGSQVVNLCQYKEKAPQIILIGSSVFLVVFALKYWYNMAIKIYRVIRSFIDGTDDTEGEE